jgi:hypothetical protein
MESIAAAIGRIQRAVAPVVYLDTCVLLDIVRAPLRNAAGAVEAALELLTGAKRSVPTIYLFVGCPTPTEWNDHIHEAVTDCSIAVNCVDAVAHSWYFLGKPGLPTLSPPSLLLPERLRTLSKNLLDAASVLDKDGEALGRAIDRIISARKPARKGGQGAKDAAILEHAISLVDALMAVGVATPRVFVSSNTNDFAIAKGTAVHPEIKSDFDPPRNIHYSDSLFAAVIWLKAGGWVP